MLRRIQTRSFCATIDRIMLRFSSLLSKHVSRLRVGTSAQRSLSVEHIQSKHVKQGGKLSIYLAADAEVAGLIITSKWQETVDVSYDGDVLDLSCTEDPDTNSMVIMSKRKNPGVPGVLQVTIPEYLDMDIGAYNVDMKLQSKMQGDITISCNSGTIVADKLRGAVLDFECGDADITIKKVLEGNSNIQCRALKAKMINGDAVQVNARNIDVDAIYGAYTHLVASEHITVGLSRGDMEAYSSDGNISVSGIDGSFDIHAERGTVRLQVNKLYPSRQHSRQEIAGSEEKISRGSFASAPEGHIIAVVDPELAASVYCRSESAGMQRMCVTVNSDAFDIDSAPGPGESDTADPVRTPRVGTWEGGMIKGQLTGKSAAVKRPEVGEGNKRSGKINLRGAEAQSQGGLTMQERHADSDASYSTPSASFSSTSTEDTPSSEGYDLTLIARGNVRVDTMSWIQVIRSKYGFEDSVGGTMPPSTPGRTASSNANAAKIANSIFDDK